MISLRRILGLLATLLCALVLASCAETEPDNTLVVGMELSYPPFEMSDENNQPTGVSVDLAKALGEHLDRPIRIENIVFTGLIPALKTGKIDLIISSMTATEERDQSIDFSDPYLKTGLCLLVAKDSPIHSIEDADREGLSIAVKQGTTGHLYAMNEIAQARVLTLEKESSAALEVAQGKADAFIYDQMSIYRNWTRHADTTRALLDPFQSESWVIGIQEGDSELQAQVNDFLRTFRENSGFEALGNKYLSEQKKAFQELGYPFFF
ncbi:transporter substrate-binding domain-containing protein [Pelagicoccus sp. SDUM812003]|uniref:transporter substrate-binding domain-containing protein n=1 Tax=Pelagicoccus sp. SDUM812003 TaxID=3041267 RepID=UPI00280CF3D3|nr:transporter substrate-binding domain-containing protein [Pelagicoccus sp. SDUM812003]MDQ8205353.1 transporter substrate-binding domain-containing protein [Pelagicoccus sp. SDUM812003]